jgi:hypothetical protein
VVEQTLLTQGLIDGPPVLDLQVKETVLGDLNLHFPRQTDASHLTKVARLQVLSNFG